MVAMGQEKERTAFYTECLNRLDQQRLLAKSVCSTQIRSVITLPLMTLRQKMCAIVNCHHE